MERRLWRPAVILACVSGAVFALAQGQFLAPSAPVGGGPVVLGDVYNGELVFEATCAGCHGTGGKGGGIGPKLAGTNLAALDIQQRVEQGAGTMPGGLVEAAEVPDVVAYVLGVATK
jgi:mono/diheme cytochrome c family protein